MITQAHQAHPELSLQQLCEMFEISRSWYYEHLKQPEDDAEEVALRDQIEQIILEFAGYGYRRGRVTPVSSEKTFRDCDHQFAPSLSGLSQCACRDGVKCS